MIQFAKGGTLADLMPHATVLVVYCDTALAGVRLALGYYQSLKEAANYKRQQELLEEEERAAKAAGFGLGMNDSQSGSRLWQKGSSLMNYSNRSSQSRHSSSSSQGGGLGGGMRGFGLGGNLGGGLAGAEDQKLGEGGGGLRDESYPSQDSAIFENEEFQFEILEVSELEAIECYLTTSATGTHNANNLNLGTPRMDIVSAFQVTINKDIVTFFIVQKRLATAETTLLAKSFVDFFVQYQVRNVYIVSAPNFKTHASKSIHLIQLPIIDIDLKDGVEALSLSTNFKDSFLVTLLALLNLEKNSLNTQCILYPGKKFTSKTSIADEDDKNMMMTMGRYVNELLELYIFDASLAEASATFLAENPNLQRADIQEEFKSHLYL